MKPQVSRNDSRRVILNAERTAAKRKDGGKCPSNTELGPRHKDAKTNLKIRAFLKVDRSRLPLGCGEHQSCVGSPQLPTPAETEDNAWLELEALRRIN